MNEAHIRKRLPEEISRRLQSLRVADGKAVAVLDASGLDEAARNRLETQALAAIQQTEGISEARVGLVADRVKRRMIAIASGKGGVGKSTLTANLAVALARMGHRTGVVDADIYGPSQPKLFANEGERPGVSGKKLTPVASAAGIPVLSVGHLVEPGRAVAWRGPMAGNALGQLIDADWGETDLLLADLPPGTGDVQLTMVQRHRPDGVVIVSTPQDLALIDAARAVQLFREVGVPVIGLVENMAGYACPHCGEISDPFGHGGAETAAQVMDMPFLGRIPLALDIRAASDAGTPPAAGEGAHADCFAAIAGQISDWLERNEG